MKTAEELNALKEEVETVSRKLAELTEEELAQVSGGSTDDVIQRYNDNVLHALEGLLNPPWAYENYPIDNRPSPLPLDK